jgi:hypothetical protein
VLQRSEDVKREQTRMSLIDERLKEMAHFTDPQETSDASCYLTIPWPLISSVPGSWD